MKSSLWLLLGSASLTSRFCHCFFLGSPTFCRTINHDNAKHRAPGFLTTTSTTSTSAARRFDEDGSSGSDGDVLARNDARVDVRNLLTQRAIQSFMFLLTSVRDPHSVKWIEEFLGTHNQLEFHGTGAGYLERFGGSWDAPLLAMMEQPKDVIVVSAKRRGKGQGGWSKDNPYLEERFVEFEIDIDPAGLASRILSVREQIAQEWVKDLDILAVANDQILESYFQKARKERQDEGGNGKSDMELKDTMPTAAFERTAVNILNNHTGFVAGASSPFRKGNFDLLFNLCTQASIHRLLRKLGKAGAAKEVSYKLLKDFYTTRVAEYFDGDQKYGRADDFMEELLRTSPSLVYTDDKKAGLADPMALAEQIIETRRDVVSEWKELMKQVPQDHSAGIRKVLLEKQMLAWNSAPSDGGFE